MDVKSKDHEMQDGYYLSCYLTIDKACNVYRVPLADRHDQAVALWKKEGSRITLNAYWEMERLTRQKHHNLAWFDCGQVNCWLDQLLQEAGVSRAEIIEIYGTPAMNPEGNYHNELAYTYHNLCHLFSAMLLETSVFYQQDILGMALDYGSDQETESTEGKNDFVGCISKKGKMEFFSVKSPAALWAVAAEANRMGEGSLMALASALKCRIRKPYSIDENAFAHIFSRNIWNIYHNLTDTYFCMTKEEFLACCEGYDERFTLKENIQSAIMKWIQEFSIEIMDRQVDRIINQYHLDPRNMTLAVGGGFCLNCPVNAHLMKKYHFKNFQAPPCINDSGQALGIGLYEFYRRMGEFTFSFGENPFRGSKIEDVPQTLIHSPFIESISPYSPAQVAEDLQRDVIIWAEGKSEIGPRALGHRSLLGDPTNRQTKIRLNQIKQREFWRPVAPVVQEETGNRYFENMLPSPFMLHIYRIRPEWREKLESISHLDGTARVQTVRRGNPYTKRIYEILEAMNERTGVPIICNTSLNDRGEPILENTWRILEFAMEKRIECVYINGRRIRMQNFEAYDGSFSTQPPVFCVQDDARKAEMNPFGIDEEAVRFILRKDRNRFDLTDPQDVQQAMEYVKELKDRSKISHE